MNAMAMASRRVAAFSGPLRRSELTGWPARADRGPAEMMTEGFLGSEAGTFPPIRNLGNYRPCINTLLGQNGDDPAIRSS